MPGNGLGVSLAANIFQFRRNDFVQEVFCPFYRIRSGGLEKMGEPLKFPGWSRIQIKDCLILSLNALCWASHTFSYSTLVFFL